MAGIRMNPLHAAMGAFKPAAGMKMPGQELTRGLGGAHFANPSFIEQGHNTSKHPGFAALVKSGVPAGALANTSRNASAAAKRRNPRLKRVK